ncbi:hypothetical protein M569_16850 [Genlisea aurea]|uniref:Uncharacterized protein n=1 Tax=Genlisea aurea TaxID=192259 RepID=S8DF12_9LAMI|nr:hypothetical protein M569_16850 [Genlisea aurea]
MAKKKSRRRAPPCGRLKTGCISGLMSIFDFRQGRITRRMISGGRLSSFNQSAAAAMLRIQHLIKLTVVQATRR